MFPALNGNGIFVFSDPGGAKPVLALAASLILNNCLVVSDRSYDFFKDFNLPVLKYNPGQEVDILTKHDPDFVFTGTSYTSQIELKFIRESQKRGIASYAFVDHYTRLMDRFLLDEEVILPDRICVVDMDALRLARQENLPADRIVVTGNPYHTYLLNWKASITREELLKKLNLQLDTKIILYAPDPLTNVGGKNKYGFDEASVLEDIATSVLDGNLPLQNFVLGLKLHPNQKKDIVNPEDIRRRGINVIDCTALDTNSILYHADLVIGMFSNILIEAELLGTPVIRVLIDSKTTDPLASRKLGAIARDMSTLTNLIREKLSIP